MIRCQCVIALTALFALSFTPALADPVKLSIIEVNDFYQMSETDGRGGFARLAAVVKAERAAGKHVLVMHAGDTFSPSLMSGFDQGEHMVALFNALGLDVFIPGNHEFDFGKEVYAKRIGEAKFAVLAANLRDAGGKVLAGHKDHLIVDVEGIKVGIVGAALDETPETSSPGDLKFAPAFETIEAEVQAMKGEGADFTVAVAHSNIANDWKMFRAHLADAFILGHTHDLRVEYDSKSAMMESGENNLQVAIMDVMLDKTVKDGKTRLSWRPNFRILDTAAVTPDPEMAALVRPYEAELSKELDVSLATLDVPLDTHEAVSRASETAFGDFVADALRAATGADVAIINGGGLRGDRDYAAGATFTRKDVLTELPFGNKTVVVRISGAGILAALENGFSKLPETAGRFPQVSGVVVTADAGKPAGARVVNVTILGRPLDPAATYTLATNDYMLGGGDGYTALKSAEVVRGPEAGGLMANDVMVWARMQAHITAKVEGRVVIGK